VVARDGRWIAFVGRNRGYQLVIVDARTGRRVVEWKPGGTFARTSPVWGVRGSTSASLDVVDGPVATELA
jgi:hypothetical protein